MLQAAASEADHYSANHAILCALVCEVCAESFDWPAEERRTLVGAALTMNLAMSALQDALAQQRGPLTGAQREQIDAHAEAGASLLAAAGLADARWIEVVRQHHVATADTVSDSPPTAEQRLAQLLHRVDIYTAKLSRRASREPASPALAARDACLDAAGLPDAIGATMLRILGLYRPGCYVVLASGDTGIVICRGAKAHTPVVAALRRADGALYNPPVRRDSSLNEQSVLHGVTPGYRQGQPAPPARARREVTRQFPNGLALAHGPSRCQSQPSSSASAIRLAADRSTAIQARLSPRPGPFSSGRAMKAVRGSKTRPKLRPCVGVSASCCRRSRNAASTCEINW